MTDLAAQILAALDRMEAEAPHIATAKADSRMGESGYWTQARALALVAALREVVELHAPRRQDPEWKALGQLPSCAECGSDFAPRRWPCPTLRALASVWDVPGDNT